ncbi:hypothetical protein [Streptomyces sp. NPDC006638]|uniref:hypothetical protein n=1 Tax=Streptomyces sp. NPDC006638 TaxID=3157183 RepID=UPI0033A6FA12
MEQQSTSLARIGTVETSAQRTRGTASVEDLAVSAPTAAGALNLLADAVRRGGADHDDIVQALEAAGVDEAFAGVFDAASERVIGAAGDVRRAFEWL